jgi:hypothetical protein
VCRYRHAVAAKYARLERERQGRVQTWACNKIGRNWKRRNELYTLRTRFDLRKKVEAIINRFIRSNDSPHYV